MELEDIQRKVQFRQGSYVVTIPLQVVHALGIRKNQYVRFAISKNKIVIKPVEPDITRKDLTEADRDSAALDESGDAAYKDDLAEALRPDNTNPGSRNSTSRIERLRMG